LRKRKDMPSRNELVIGTVKSIYDHGAFITLDEYNGLEAYVPLNEVSHSWFRGIKEVLKVGQKRVFKVIRVIPKKKQVDVSLKRVSDGERRAKIIAWKRAQRADKLLEIAAQRLNKTLEEAYREAGWKIEDYYGEIFAGLEEAALHGLVALTKAGVKEPWASVLTQLAKAYIKISGVKISGIINISCISSNGVELIKEAFKEGEKVAEKWLKHNVKVKMYVIGAPRYRIDIEALDYKVAEKVLSEIVEVVSTIAKKNNCTFSYQRVKKRR